MLTVLQIAWGNMSLSLSNSLGESYVSVVFIYLYSEYASIMIQSQFLYSFNVCVYVCMYVCVCVCVHVCVYVCV